MKTATVLFILSIFATNPLYALEGYKQEGGHIYIDSNSQQGKVGSDVTYIDEKDGQYHSGYMIVQPNGSAEITDDKGNTFYVDTYKPYK